MIVMSELSRLTVFEDSYMQFVNLLREKEVCSISDIIELVKIMQDNEQDCHVVIAGQNGSGKSFLNLMFLKELQGEEFLSRYYLADKTTNDIIQYLLTNNNVPLGIDEMNLYFSYKDHASYEQNHLIKMIELARSKSIAFVGCVRDPRKLTLNYRDGKMSVIIWILDRFRDKSGAYAAVLVGNPIIEGEDRFGLQQLMLNTPDFSDMRYQIESLPSFVCYIKIPPIDKVLTKDEISKYKTYKDHAMASAHLNQCIFRFKKGKIDADDFTSQIRALEPILGMKFIDAKVAGIKPKKQSSLNDFGDDNE